MTLGRLTFSAIDCSHQCSFYSGLPDLSPALSVALSANQLEPFEAALAFLLWWVQPLLALKVAPLGIDRLFYRCNRS